ncbi:hypothetical protein Golomagni_05551 [Golovinomyces magnicellulatus]|nr:hypothetical protein Golomagni_05551 [Golovinomyces magnicellulatus]
MPNTGKKLLRLNKPINQNIVCGLILFCLPGIYTALTALGAGGGKPTSLVIANQTNAILYGVFILFACMGGTIVNILGPRFSLMLGTLGYPLYVGGLWYYDNTAESWFPLFAGAILGALSGVLWTCVGMVAYAYADENQKGLFLYLQWALRSLGASVGAAIAFGVNYNQTKPVGVSSSVYIIFIVLQTASLLLSGFLIVDPKDVVRDDGTHLAEFQPPSFSTEIKRLRNCFTDRSLLLLTPAMVVCEMPLGTLSTVNGK